MGAAPGISDVSNAMLFYHATQRAKMRARLPEPAPELIEALRERLLGFKFVSTASDGIRRQVQITNSRAGDLRESGVLKSLAEAIQAVAVDPQWLEEHEPRFAEKLAKEEIERLDRATLLTGYGSAEWRRTNEEATQRYRELVRKRQPSPRGGPRSTLPRAEILLEEFNQLSACVEEQWSEILTHGGTAQRRCLAKLSSVAGLPETFNKNGAQMKALGGSIAKNSRSFTVRFLAGGYGKSRSSINRLIRHASRKS